MQQKHEELLKSITMAPISVDALTRNYPLHLPAQLWDTNILDTKQQHSASSNKFLNNKQVTQLCAFDIWETSQAVPQTTTPLAGKKLTNKCIALTWQVTNLG